MAKSVAGSKRKPKQKPSKAVVTAKPDADLNMAYARAALHPRAQASVTLQQYAKRLGDLDLLALAIALDEQTGRITDGDLKGGEAMLAAQAYTLDAIFNNLARRATNAKCLATLDGYLKLALRAQSQCRANWEALSTMKHPPLGYVRQANIAHGPQQVNNAAPTPAQNAVPQSKLLGESDGERLDGGAQGPSGEADPAMEAVATLDRPDYPGG